MKLLLYLLFFLIVLPLPWRKIYRGLGLGAISLMYVALVYGPWLVLAYILNHFCMKYW